MPLLAKGGTQTARPWSYLRDDRPFAGGAPPAALYSFSTDRRKEHPTRHLAGWTGILQAPSRGLRANHCRATDAYGGYNDHYSALHKPAPVLSALCWSHAPSHRLQANDCRAAGRKFFELADIKAIAEVEVLAFTPFGVENLLEMIAMERDRQI